jgi:hypothetical protein
VQANGNNKKSPANRGTTDKHKFLRYLSLIDLNKPAAIIMPETETVTALMSFDRFQSFAFPGSDHPVTGSHSPGNFKLSLISLQLPGLQSGYLPAIRTGNNPLRGNRGGHEGKNYG